MSVLEEANINLILAKTTLCPAKGKTVKTGQAFQVYQVFQVYLRRRKRSKFKVSVSENSLLLDSSSHAILDALEVT